MRHNPNLKLSSKTINRKFMVIPNVHTDLKTLEFTQISCGILSIVWLSFHCSMGRPKEILLQYLLPLIALRQADSAYFLIT